MLRFAANLSWLYTEFEFVERFAAAARDGFTAVECLFPYEYRAPAVAGCLEENGLKLVLINAPPGDWAAGERGLACLPGRENDFRDSIEAALAYAGTLGCPRVHVMAGLAPQGVAPEKIWGSYLANLRWASEKAAAERIQLLIEPINLRDMPGYFLHQQQQAHEIVMEVGSPFLKVQMDLYHCQMTEGDAYFLLRRYLQAGPDGNIGHIQVAGIPDRHEPLGGYDELFDVIESLGYSGWIGCEYRPRAGTSEGLEWLRGRRRHAGV